MEDIKSEEEKKRKKILQQRERTGEFFGCYWANYRTIKIFQSPQKTKPRIAYALCELSLE